MVGGVPERWAQNNTWNVCMENFAEAMHLLSGEISYETTGSQIYRGILDQIDDRHRAIGVLKALFAKRKEALLEYTIAEQMVEVELRKQHHLEVPIQSPAPAPAPAPALESEALAAAGGACKPFRAPSAMRRLSSQQEASLRAVYRVYRQDQAFCTVSEILRNAPEAAAARPPLLGVRPPTRAGARQRGHGRVEQ